MTQDKMQDVHPINYNFGKGEQANSEKLTGGVKQTDAGFDRMSSAIGDLWDYSSHTKGSLSLENLSLSNLSRIIGSSDWFSPDGCWTEVVSDTILIYLSKDRNSWNLGFPLIKVISDLDHQSTSTSISDLTWSTDISVSVDTDNVLTGSPKATKDLVVADGDFYIDYNKGTVEAYKVSSVDITLQIASSKLNMFGPGVPWGTQNVIPRWEQSTLCTVAKVGDFGTISRYTLTFPTVSGTGRITPVKKFGKRSATASVDEDTEWNKYSGESTKYRVPQGIITAGYVIGDTIPEGYCLLWQGGRTGRVVPQVTFKYASEYSFTVETPIDWLNVGANYRVIIPGSSVAETINYLMQQVRNNEHIGVSDNPTLGYTIPLSHDNLENRYTGLIDNTLTDVDRWKFRESSYPTNSHPQYLHRGGYMTNDENGNTANAMRGNFVFAGDVSGDGTGGFALYNGVSVSNNVDNTPAIVFGGGTTTKNSNTQNTNIRLEGLRSDASWLSGRAIRIPFAFTDSGASPTYAHGASTDKQQSGGLSLYPGQSGPLYLRGSYDTSDEIKNGAVLGFDLGHRNEANYIRAMEAVRATTYDVTNLPAKKSQGNTALDITPDLTTSAPGTTKRFAPEQLREFRFRGLPWVVGASNADDSLGGTTTRSGDGEEEFEEYFTSPGIVGADFFNVYSNAIFFSDTGDGKATSLTTGGDTWLNGTGTFNSDTPTGIFFVPYDSGAPTTTSKYVFNVNENGTSRQTLRVGYSSGFYYNGTDFGAELDTGDFDFYHAGTGNFNIDVSTGGNFDLDAIDVLIDSSDDITIQCGDYLTIASVSTMDITSASAGMNITTAAGNITIEGNTGAGDSIVLLPNLPSSASGNRIWKDGSGFLRIG
jgi:hypothetical protein